MSLNRSIHFITVCFLFASVICNAQKDTLVDSVKYNHIKYFSNGQIQELGNYKTKGKNKIKEGYWITYKEDSTINEKGNYIKNKKSGPWHERLPLRDPEYWSGNYKKGRRDGRWSCYRVKIFYKRGKIKSRYEIKFS